MAHLTVEQEEEIVSDPTFLLVALCAVGNWTVEQITETYDLTLAECIECLTRLDRRRIIELQPGNRIRPLPSAYGSRGTYMNCEYRMTTPYQGTGTCKVSTGAMNQVHIGG